MAVELSEWIIKTMARELLSDAKKGIDNYPYTMKLPTKMVEKYGVKILVENTIGYIGSLISEMDTEKKYLNHSLTTHYEEKDNTITVQWYNKNRDKKHLIKHEAVEWCNGCKEFKPFADFKKCGQCQCERYCSRECQKSHWKEHKKVCEPKKN
jgi:hypothetical protein